ncbi:hypothetical protein F511_04723 [Dorcoceras hygrometricum]|uniref:Uncharacterized protein n=1 Tax=Dorcoceras hygrometricum TaxID=472368 RepID=A0A2Z7B1X3_9LAMI|nr:hypothetical protein F511_04723 [Dorcoceras hygrometricum]
MRSARSDSPRKTRPEQIPAKLAAAAGGARRRRAAHGGGGVVEGEKRGRRRFARKSHFPKSSSRAQHIELSIRVGISNPVLDLSTRQMVTTWKVRRRVVR